MIEMREILASKIPLEFLDRLHEFTLAKARHAWNAAKEITPNADQRLVGHARQDAHQEAFKAAAAANELVVADFRPIRGMPTRYVLDFGDFNLVALKNNATHSNIEVECRALAMLADEKRSVGAEVFDLFTGRRIIQTNKPLFAWTAVWTGSKSRASALPTWSGFCEIEATSDRHVRSVGVGLDYSDVRGSIIERTAVEPQSDKKKKFTPRPAPSEEVKRDD